MNGMATYRARHAKVPKTVVYPKTEALESRNASYERRGYGRAKWIDFILTLRAQGLRVGVYEAATTFSKYVYVIFPGGGVFKVRFSNHRPAKSKQVEDDSDFYVGVSNGLVTRTEDALAAIYAIHPPPYDYAEVPPPTPKRTAPEKENEAVLKQRPRVPIICGCGNTFVALRGCGTRRCRQCGKRHRT